MKGILSRIVAVILAAMVAISSIGVAVAQEETELVESDAFVRVLAVSVPRSAQVDEQITISVTDRVTGVAVEGAGVYAIGWRMGSLLNIEVDETADSPWGYSCQFLGETDGSGVVVHTFSRVGRYLIVATMDEYGPGLALLNVRPSVLGRLQIVAPGRSAVDQPVTIRIVERNGGGNVSEADVWAIKMPARISAYDWDFSRIDNDARKLLEESEDGDVKALLERIGEYLGETGEDGGLTHTFTEVGRYLLLSTKSGYVPGIESITIVADKTLAIKAPRSVDTGEEVILKTVTRGTGTPVAGVDLYALRTVSGGFRSLDIGDIEAAGPSMKGWVVEKGEHLGTTNDSGELKHQFSEAGIYLVIGDRDGYVPGFTVLWVGQSVGLKNVVPQAEGLKQLLPRIDGLRRLSPRVEGFLERINEHPWNR